MSDPITKLLKATQPAFTGTLDAVTLINNRKTLATPQDFAAQLIDDASAHGPVPAVTAATRTPYAGKDVIVSRSANGTTTATFPQAMEDTLLAILGSIASGDETTTYGGDTRPLYTALVVARLLDGITAPHPLMGDRFDANEHFDGIGLIAKKRPSEGVVSESVGPLHPEIAVALQQRQTSVREKVKEMLVENLGLGKSTPVVVVDVDAGEVESDDFSRTIKSQGGQLS